jgi:transposase
MEKKNVTMHILTCKLMNPRTMRLNNCCSLCRNVCSMGEEIRCYNCISAGRHNHNSSYSCDTVADAGNCTAAILLSLFDSLPLLPPPSDSSLSSSTTPTNLTVTVSPPTTPIKPSRFEANGTSPPRRTLLDRYRMVVYGEDGMKNSQIAKKLRCSVNTVKRWRTRYEELKDKNERIMDAIRKGRTKTLDEKTEREIVEWVKEVKFTTPRMIKAVFDLDVSKRTIDRLLIKNGLFGRMARRKHPKVQQYMMFFVHSVVFYS